MNINMTVLTPGAAKSQTTTYTGTAGSVTLPAMSTTYGPSLQAVWVVVTTDAFVRVGAAAVADVDMYVPAFTPVVIAATDGVIVSAIRVSVSGSIYVTPLN